MTDTQQATELLSDAEIDAVIARLNRECDMDGMDGDSWDKLFSRAIAAHLSSKRDGETYLMVGRSDDNFKTLTPPGLKKGIPVYVKATFAPGVISDATPHPVSEQLSDVLPDIDEAYDVINSLIENIAEHGNYTPQTTMCFLNEALNAIRDGKEVIIQRLQGKIPERRKILPHCKVTDAAYSLGWNECIDAMLTAAQPVEPAWQPIETAPKDGTRILGYFPFCNDRYAIEFRSNEYVVGEDWTLDDGESATLTYDHPTYWMPIPPSPTQQQANGEVG